MEKEECELMAQEFLINILFILLSVLLHHVWAEKQNRFRDRAISNVIFSLTIISCIIFPISYYAHFVQDLRQIPFILGCLYGGILSYIILYAVMILFHCIYYGVNDAFLFFLTTYGILGVVTALYAPKFLKHATKQKLRDIFTISFTFSIVSIIITSGLTKVDPGIEIFITSVMVPPIAIIVTCYMIEMMKNNISLRKQIVKSEKSKVVSQLAASVSHEVRNPLTVTRGFLQLVMENDELPPQKRKEFIQTAIEELDHAESIIRDYLTFAKPAPERWELLDIGEELERVEDIITSYANMNSVEIKTELVTSIIQGNKQQFQQCFLNIMKNGVEAMPDGGVLEIYMAIYKKHVVITISDTGVGMTQEQIDRLGEPYFSTKEKGTGLGMMVVFSIIKAFKGTVKIESELGKGTRILIRFPIALP